MANLARLFDPPPLMDKENGDIFVFSFLYVGTGKEFLNFIE